LRAGAPLLQRIHVTTREERRDQTVDLFRKVYGYQYVPRYHDSPHEGDDLDDAELVLHELAHQTLMPEEYVFTPGHMKWAVEVVGNYIEQMPRWQQDLNEVKTLAIEFIVNRRLDLGLDEFVIAEKAAQNSWGFQKVSDLGRWALAVQNAKKLFSVQIRAETICELLELVKEDKL
jgi:hypothetical protein